MSTETSVEQRCPLNADYNPFDPAQLEDPYSWLRDQRAREPVFFSPVIGMWVVTRHADADHVLRHPDVFSSEGALVGRNHPEVTARLECKVPMTATLIGMDRPGHTRLRRIVNAAFTHARVAAMEDEVRRIVIDLIDGLPEDQPFDVLKDFSYPLALTVIAGLIGIPREQIQRCHDLSEEWNHLLGAEERGMPLEDQLRCADAALEYHAYISELIAEREHEPADDLITAAWDVRRKGDVQLSDLEMLSLFPGLISAGHETTANLIANGLWHLLEIPDRWQGLVHGNCDIPALVEECSGTTRPFTGCLGASCRTRRSAASQSRRATWYSSTSPRRGTTLTGTTTPTTSMCHARPPCSTCPSARAGTSVPERRWRVSRRASPSRSSRRAARGCVS